MPRDPKKPISAQKSLNLVGKRVRSLRTISRWSQTDLAANCQLSGWDAGRDIVAKIESGNRQITDHELVVLAWVLGVTVAELIGETPLPAQNDKLADLLSARRTARIASKMPSLLPGLNTNSTL